MILLFFCKSIAATALWTSKKNNKSANALSEDAAIKMNKVEFTSIMRRCLCFFALLLQSTLFSVDFDYAVVGTSPFLLFEALYKHASGYRVLILEAANECGGAWKSIEACGVPHVDMGCHEIGSTPELNRFLEEYAGCSLVKTNYSYYFSEGCFELIDHLLERVSKTNIVLRTNCRLNSVTLDAKAKIASLQTTDGIFTACKIVVTPGSSFVINPAKTAQKNYVREYFHLYFLIQDPTPPRFSYHGGVSAGVSRMMNLTSYAKLANTGRQLIVFQTHTRKQFENHESFLNDLKRTGLIDMGAYLLKTDTYVYEQGPPFQINQLTPEQQSFFELINTSHFNVIGQYAAKWKTVLTPYRFIK